jgi:hypothetical protein
VPTACFTGLTLPRISAESSTFKKGDALFHNKIADRERFPHLTHPHLAMDWNMRLYWA